MKKRYFLIAAVLLLALGLWRIYANNTEAIKQTKAIIATDMSGGNINAAMTTLQDYVRSHMGASVSFELTGSYNRDVQKAHDASQPDVNGALYAQATAACASKDAVAQAQCIQNYVSAHPSAATKVVAPPDRILYRRQVTAPGWTPDLAGLSLLGAGTAVLLAGWLWLIDALSKRF